MNRFKDAKRIVIKIGTSTLTHTTGLINIRRVEQLVKVIADLKNAGREIIVVTSGAIGVGVGKLGLLHRPEDTPGKQACAAVGQCELMYLYDKMFSEYNHIVAQILITKDVTQHPKRAMNVTNTFQKLLEMGAIPIVNENDTISTDEIVFGDNDTLSAVVANLVEADGLIILSDIDGLYTADPRTDATAQLIRHVVHVDEQLFDSASGAGTSRGTGGMMTKLQAAKLLADKGIVMAIINGSRPELLYDLLDGKEVGTCFGEMNT